MYLYIYEYIYIYIYISVCYWCCKDECNCVLRIVNDVYMLVLLVLKDLCVQCFNSCATLLNVSIQCLSLFNVSLTFSPYLGPTTQLKMKYVLHTHAYYALQHTAIHCEGSGAHTPTMPAFNTLQHTPTHSNALQHTATH